MALNQGTIIEGYEIIETIGTGAMSTVYLAKKDSDSYAIKELKSEFSSAEEEEILINAFHREAELLSSIEHPGIPKLYNSFRYNEKSYLVMEYIKGTSLEEIIKGKTKPFEEQKALQWGIQICEILCYLHNLSPEPVIYRDLKPSNIIITQRDRLRLIDFGVARRYDPAKNCDTVRLGTPGYAAPEQCRKKGQSIPQSDIYALGIVLHQLLTLYDPSVTPFKLPAVRKLNPGVSEQLEYLINKAINLNPRDRYIDTGLFRDELVEYYEENFTPFTSPYRENMPYMKDIKPSSPDIHSRSRSLLPRMTIGIMIAAICLGITITWLCVNILRFITTDSKDSSRMVLIKGGTYEMGPKYHTKSVTVGDFYIGKYEVTNKEYYQYDPKHKGCWSDSDYPVETVSWDDAVAYCKWLSNKTGKNYRLPTEAEWEYACRAGTTTAYYWGNKMDNFYCWYEGNSGGQVHPVGQKEPNAWGLYDMIGNVSEWCSDMDRFAKSDYVSRGGNINCDYNVCQSWFCGGSLPGNRYGRSRPDNSYEDCGFRVVMAP